MLRWSIQLLKSTELTVLLALLIVVAGTWGFIELADEVLEQETQTVDAWVLQSLRRPQQPQVPIGPRWLVTVGLDLTALGSVSVLTLVTFIVLGYLLIRRLYHAAGFVAVAVIGGALLNALLKTSFARLRPDVVPHLTTITGFSFPSGHSMMSAIVYLTLGALLTRFVPEWRLRFYFLGIALFLTLIVGLTRVYIGVHYPSDVLAGWTAGLTWATLCWLAARYLQQHGKVQDKQFTSD